MRALRQAYRLASMLPAGARGPQPGRGHRMVRAVLCGQLRQWRSGRRSKPSRHGWRCWKYRRDAHQRQALCRKCAFQRYAPFRPSPIGTVRELPDKVSYLPSGSTSFTDGATIGNRAVQYLRPRASCSASETGTTGTSFIHYTADATLWGG